MRDLPKDAEPILEKLRADVRASAGLELSVRVRWVSPAEQKARDAEWDRLAADPNVQHVVIGSRPLRHPLEEDLDDYLGYWALELSNSTTAIFEPLDVLDPIQEYVIEELWQAGRSASWPECPEHGGHPLNSVVADGGLFWRCPQDASVSLPVGELGSDDRFN